jgi:hypothetical protein
MIWLMVFVALAVLLWMTLIGLIAAGCVAVSWLQRLWRDGERAQ